MAPTLKKALKSLKKGIPGGSSSLDLQGVSTGLLGKSFSSIYVLKILHSLPKPHKTCKARPIRAYRTLPSETLCQKVCLSSNPSGGHSKLATRVCGGWWVERNRGTEVLHGYDCQWFGIESEVYVRRFLDLLVLIFDTCNG
jgi:hypothetical protein